MSLRRQAITVKRVIKDLKLTVPLNCAVGSITVLRDVEGTLIKEYQEILTNENRPGISEIEFEGTPIALQDRVLLGFDSVVEDYPSAASYLLASGFHEDECDDILRRYELAHQAYLPLRLLPPTAQRQLQLLVMMRNTPRLIVLNDPFMPFSGRWREAFAELLLEYVRKTNGTVVILHLSFKPKAWQEKPEIREVDLGLENERALQRHCAIKIEEEKKPDATVAHAEKRIAQDQKKSESPAPIVDITAKETWATRLGEGMLRQLASFSSSVRTLHGALAFFAFATLVGVIGYVSYPEAKRSWAKMHQIAANFDNEESSLQPTQVTLTGEEVFAAEDGVSGDLSLQVPEGESYVVPDQATATDSRSIGEGAPVTEPSHTIIAAMMVDAHVSELSEVAPEAYALLVMEWLNPGSFSSSDWDVPPAQQVCETSS